MTEPVVLHVTDRLGTGGTERAALTYASVCGRFKVRSVVSGFNATGPLAREADELRIESVDFNSDPASLRGYVRSNGVNVVHFHSGFRGDFKAALEIKSLHGVRLIQTNYFGWFDRIAAAGLPDLILFGSRFSLGRFRWQCGARWTNWSARVYVSYIPIDDSIYSKSELERRNLRKDLGIPDETIVLGRVGRPDPRKLDDYLLRVLLDSALKDVDWRMILVGGIPAKLKQRAGRQGLWSRFYVTNSDVPAARVASFLSAMDIVTHTSRVGECPGSAVLEAMAASLPVVAQRTPYADDALPELIEPRTNGFLEITPGRFARRVAYIAENLSIRDTLGTGSRRLFDRRFSTSILIPRYVAALRVALDADVGAFSLPSYLNDAAPDGSGSSCPIRHDRSADGGWGELTSAERAQTRFSTGCIYSRFREYYFRARAFGYRLTQSHLSHAR